SATIVMLPVAPVLLTGAHSPTWPPKPTADNSTGPPAVIVPPYAQTPCPSPPSACMVMAPPAVMLPPYAQMLPLAEVTVIEPVVAVRLIVELSEMRTLL